MKIVVRNVLPYQLIDEVWGLYRNTTNVVEIDGNRVDRHASGLNGVFLLSKYTKEEFKNIWGAVKDSILESLSYEVELVYCRILKYGYNGFIAKHVDSYAEKTQQPTDLSIIIQLSDPASYNGGELIVENQLMGLQPGDMLAYTYEHEHEVKRVKEGIRYVINLRCKMVK